MNIEHINEVLGKAIGLIEGREIEGLAMISEQDDFEDEWEYDMAPMGDPETGGAGGVANYSHEDDIFSSYLSDVVGNVMAATDCSEDDAWNAMETVASAMESSGELPMTPDPESSTAEQLTTWTLAAKMAGFGRRVSDQVTMDLGL